MPLGEDLVVRAPEVPDARIVPRDAVLVGIGRVVLLGHETGDRGRRSAPLFQILDPFGQQAPSLTSAPTSAEVAYGSSPLSIHLRKSSTFSAGQAP